jgi:hypothetical protein
MIRNLRRVSSLRVVVGGLKTDWFVCGSQRRRESGNRNNRRDVGWEPTDMVSVKKCCRPLQVRKV